MLVDFDMDTGAGVSLMLIGQARELFKGENIYSTKLSLLSLCKNNIQVLGFLSLNVTYNNYNLKLNLYLTNVNRTPLLGREWMRQLGMIDENRKIITVSFVNKLNVCTSDFKL